jgi:hypothetical protein
VYVDGLYGDGTGTGRMERNWPEPRDEEGKWSSVQDSRKKPFLGTRRKVQGTRREYMGK